MVLNLNIMMVSLRVNLICLLEKNVFIEQKLGTRSYSCGVPHVSFMDFSNLYCDEEFKAKN